MSRVSVLALRDAFIQKTQAALASLDILVNCLEQTLAQAVEENQEDISQPLRDRWLTRVKALREEVSKTFWKFQVRPSLVVVGKRGQGKSTLVNIWIGEGCSDDLRLPTGVQETTCCLTRLTTDQRYPRDVLTAAMLPDHAYKMVDGIQWPDRPTQILTRDGIFQVDRTVYAPKASPYLMLRYPIDNQDEYLYLVPDQSSQRYHITNKRGGEPLTAVQYHVAEVVVSYDLEKLQSFARRTLHHVDIVDAPGADPSAKGRYPEWVRRKNGLVFTTGADRIDMLLLVASAETAAINLGAQLQEEILSPWYQRCREESRGRIGIVITHAAVLLDEAHLGQDKSQANSPATKIVKNILEPLEAVGLLKLDGNLDDWPPLFFVELNHDRLSTYRQDWPSDSNRTDRLFSLFERYRHTPTGVPWESLSTTEQRILLLAYSWTEYGYRWDQSKVDRLVRWTISVFCQLIDGHALDNLTDFVTDWVELGVVAHNYILERSNDLDTITKKVQQLLTELNQEDFSPRLDFLKAQQRWLCRHWNATRTVLRTGELCKRRFQLSQKNANIDPSRQETFGFEHVVKDVIVDTLCTLASCGESLAKDSTIADRKILSSMTHLLEEDTYLNHDLVRKILDQPELQGCYLLLRECMTHDYYLNELGASKDVNLPRDPDLVARIQAFTIERIIRVIDYVVDANEARLRAILRDCFKSDLHINQVLREIYRNCVADKHREILQQLDEAISIAGRVQTALHSSRPRLPY